MLNYVTILKSGGDYSPVDVIALAAQVRKHLTIPHEFVCYTDTEINHELVVELELQNKYPKSWSVLEMWKHTGTVIVTGLDTIVTGDINRLGELALACPEDEIYLCRPRNKRMIEMGFWANGITIFNGDWSWIIEDFKYLAASHHFRWEQMYVSDKLKKAGTKVNIVQDKIEGWHSYKELLKAGKNTKKPKNAKIVTFAGHPRPNECEEGWIVKAYNTYKTWDFKIPFEEIHDAQKDSSKEVDNEDLFYPESEK